MVRKLSVEEMNKVYHKHIVKDFPASEVKSWKSIEQGVSDGKYYAYAMMTDEVVIDETVPYDKFTDINTDLLAYAFFINSTVNDILLLDYLAVVQGKRSEGIGSSFLQQLKQIAAKEYRQLILEVENPDYAQLRAGQDNMIRRIGFYQKNGMQLSQVSCNFMDNEYRILYVGCDMESVKGSLRVSENQNVQNDVQNNMQLQQMVEAVYRDFFSDIVVDKQVQFHQLIGE